MVEPDDKPDHYDDEPVKGRFPSETGPELQQYVANLVYHGPPFHLKHALEEQRYWETS